MLQFLSERLPAEKFRHLVHSAYFKFMEELLQFNDQYDEYIIRRDELSYQQMNEEKFDLFNRYSFRINDDLEDQVYGFSLGKKKNSFQVGKIRKFR